MVREDSGTFLLYKRGYPTVHGSGHYPFYLQLYVSGGTICVSRSCGHIEIIW